MRTFVENDKGHRVRAYKGSYAGKFGWIHLRAKSLEKKIWIIFEGYPHASCVDKSSLSLFMLDDWASTAPREVATLNAYPEMLFHLEAFARAFGEVEGSEFTDTLGAMIRHMVGQVKEIQKHSSVVTVRRGPWINAATTGGTGTITGNTRVGSAPNMGTIPRGGPDTAPAARATATTTATAPATNLTMTTNVTTNGTAPTATANSAAPTAASNSAAPAAAAAAAAADGAYGIAKQTNGPAPTSSTVRGTTGNHALPFVETVTDETQFHLIPPDEDMVEGWNHPI